MTFLKSLARFFTAFYRYHYWLGVWAIRKWNRFGRWFGRVTAPARRRVRYHWTRRVKWPVHRFARKQRNLRRRTAAGFRFIGRQALKNPFSIIPNFFKLFVGAIDHYWEELAALGRLLAPGLAGVVLALTVVAWVNAPYRLNLTYQGEDLGTVTNSSVYDAGAALARDRVINEDNSFSVDAVPTYTITVQGWKTSLTEEQVCDGILRTAGDSIAEACGLYVDGKFIGAMESETALNDLLEELKDGHYDKDDKNQRAEFVQEVTTTEGLYPISAVRDKSTIKKKLTAQTVKEMVYTVQAGDVLGTIAEQFDLTVSQLRELNPAVADTDYINIGDKLTVQRPQTFLQVKVVKTVQYTETIDYKTKTVYRDDKPSTYSKVITAGQEGKREVIAEDTYVDGLKTERKIIKRTVTKEAVTKVMEVGTQKVVNSDGAVIQQGDGVSLGSMTWPVPICHNVYQGYHRGHLAIDISSGPVPVFNASCLAADGGTVLYAGWYYGYGKYVKIQHANGLVTTYAHLNTISVVAGQKVSRGQQIGRVGNTGNSTGPHLHFEVIKNGVRVNPLNYVTP